LRTKIAEEESRFNTLGGSSLRVWCLI
jgi:hypothetical protein